MEQKILRHIIDNYRTSFSQNLVITNQKAVGGGCISTSIKLETNHGNFFLKWNANTPADLFTREAESLQALGEADQSDLLIPKVVLAHEAGQLPGYLLMDYLMPGHAPSEDEKLGMGLARLHRKTNKAFGFSHNNYCGATEQDNRWNSDWIAFFGSQRILYLVEKISQHRALASKERNTYEKLVARLPELIPADTTPSLIHGDLWSGNYLYTSQGPALIDPAAYYADREMELSMMTMFGGFSRTCWSAYQNEFPLNPGWEERIELYQLYHVLNHYYLFGGFYGSQALSLALRFL
ncbi:fructosamine kinase family protein [uncultured Sunxiuqinia sp.]|uniref:fructosamine kinase family protein n=1 Tax=uncultured Sunxiuqinia sp. TaxID=1573825 RepID=UPI00261E3B1D|nr:fructosamine kinase family protein [uncultured Sunxiuqinia sp.]